MLAARRDPLHLLGERLPLLGRREPRRALEHIPREAERGVGRERLREPPPLGGDARGEGVPFAQALEPLAAEEICAAGARGATSRATVRVEAARRPRPANIAKAVTRRSRVLQRILRSRQQKEELAAELFDSRDQTSRRALAAAALVRAACATAACAAQICDDVVGL